MLSRFWFDDKCSLDFGLRIEKPVGFGSSAASVERTSIPGRSGDIIISNNRFENYPLTYPVWFRSKKDEVAHRTRAVKAWLNSSCDYRRLADSYNEGYFRYAAFYSAIEPEIVGNTAKFEIAFDCKPFLYRTDGDRWLDIPARTSTIINPEPFPSRPMIEATIEAEAGETISGNLFINNHTLSVKFENTGTQTAEKHFIIDCETQDAYYEAENLNRYINTADIELPTGTIQIMSQNFKTLKIKPRWRTI